MANIRVNSDCPIFDGMSITFKTPCDCNAVTGLIVYYPETFENADSETSQIFTFRDARGENLSGVNNVFGEGVYLKAVLDTRQGYAYLQNAESSSYLENIAEGQRIATKYIWKRRRTYTSDDEGTSTSRSFSYYISGYPTTAAQSTTIYYSDSFTQNDDDTISLDNKTSVTITGSSASTSDSTVIEAWDVVKGKYWTTTNATSYDSVYYTPEDADSATLSSSSTSQTVQVPVVNPYTGEVVVGTQTVTTTTYSAKVTCSVFSIKRIYEGWEYITSDKSDTYPTSGISGGYDWEYIGSGLENVGVTVSASFPGEYLWERRKTYTADDTGTLTRAGYSYYSTTAYAGTGARSTTIYYSDSYTQNSDDTISLTNKASVTITGTSATTTDNAIVEAWEVIKGKYWYISDATSYDYVYYTPADAPSATLTSSSSTQTVNVPFTNPLTGETGVAQQQITTTTYIATVSYSVFAKKRIYEGWEYITSDRSDTYPTAGISNGYDWVYHGSILEILENNAEIAAGTKLQMTKGSYTGTGTAGSSNKNSLSFDFTPKVLIVQAATGSQVLQLFNGQTAGIVINTGSTTTYSVIASWSGNTVSWYYSSSSYPAYQLNTSGTVYHYVAWG